MHWWNIVYDRLKLNDLLQTPGRGLHGRNNGVFRIISKKIDKITIQSGKPKIHMEKFCFDELEKAFLENPNLWLRAAARHGPAFENSVDKLIRDISGSQLARGNYFASILEHCGLVRYSMHGNQKGIEIIKESCRDKYFALENYLRGIRSKGSITLSFSEIQDIISDSLPISAFKYRPWWGNTKSHTQASAWMDAGWKVDGVDLRAEKVNFIRSGGSSGGRDNANDMINLKERRRLNMIKSDRIEDLIRNFTYYLSYFNKNIPFTGPSIYFHKKTIEMIRSCQRYDDLFEDTYFFEYLYATLVSWGMHHMGKKGAKMTEFEDFKKSLCLNKDRILDLSGVRLELIPENNLDLVKKKIENIFDSLKVMSSSRRLVGNSKVLHHILPELVPPVDNEHTIRFFYDNKNIYNRETSIFLECFEKFRDIARFLNVNEFELTGFNTSIPKIIDNAIIGYVMKNLK